MKPEEPVQRQLDAYNARNLARFVAEYAPDVRVFRPPGTEPVISGQAALSDYYAANRFSLPDLHAQLVARMVLGNKVVDHERISGIGEGIVELVAVYEVVAGRIQSVWFFSAGQV
jgi:hypothetical protein